MGKTDAVDKLAQDPGFAPTPATPLRFKIHPQTLPRSLCSGRVTGPTGFEVGPIPVLRHNARMNMLPLWETICRRFLFFLLAALAGALPLPAGEVQWTTPPSASELGKAAPLAFPLKLGHWNIRWFPGGHPTKSTPETVKAQREGVLELLEHEKPDILFACEIRNLKALQDLNLSYPFLACTDIPRTEEEDPSLPQQGMALLSRHPWKELWALDFSEIPETPDKPSRGILGAFFEDATGRPLTLYGVHLKSNRGDASSNFLRRRRALDYLEKDWKKRGLDPAKDPVILLGDFNTSPDDPRFSGEPTLKRLKELGFINAGESLPPDQRATIPASDRFPANNFDHIYLSATLAAKQPDPRPVLRIIPINTLTVSDHYPLFLRLE